MTITSDHMSSTASATTEATAPITAGSDHYALAGVPWISADIHGTEGTLTVGPVGVPVRLTPAVGDEPATIQADLSEVTLAAISAAVVAAGGTDPLSALPPAISSFVGSLAIGRVRVAVDPTARTVTEVSVTVAADRPLPLIPGQVEIAGPSIALVYTRAGDSHTVAVVGTGTLLGSAVRICVQRADDDSFAIALTGPDGGEVAVPSAERLAALVGAADVTGVLPAQLGDAAGLSISTLEITMNTGGVESLQATVTTTRSIELPDPFALSIRRLSIDIAVVFAAARSMTVTVSGEARFAGADIVMTIARTDGQWHLTGALAPGSTLSASAIARTYGTGLPAHLPELALTELTLAVAFGTGEVSVTAGSSTEWTVPIGPDGIGVGGLRVCFTRHAPDAAGRTFTGSISGEVHLGGAVLRVGFDVPGRLRLAATASRFAPFALLRDLCGATVVRSLALPPELLALALTDLELTIDVERSEANFAATGPGFKRVQAVVRRATSWGFAVGIELDDDYRFSSLSPALGGLDRVHLPDALIVISSFDDTAFRFDELPPIAGTGITRGLLVDGRLDLSGLGADKFLGESHLDVTAHIGDSLGSLSLAAGIGDVDITDGVVLRHAEFELVPDPENVSVTVSGAVDVTIDAGPLEFIGGVRVVPNGISFFATMKGSWLDPFGARGVALTDVSLEIGSDFEGVPSIGISGGLRIGAFTGTAAVSFNSEMPSQSVLIVAFNHLSLMDVVGTFCPPSLGAGIPADVRGTLAGVSLDDVELYVVPQDTSIGAIRYDQGMRVAGTMHVAGFSAAAEVDIDPAAGISAAGTLSPVHIADVFSLTGDGTASGPSVDIVVRGTQAPTIRISGRASLLGITAAAHVSLSDKGFDFGCRGKVFGAFDAALSVKGASLQSADGFVVHAQMSQNFLSDLTSRAATVLQSAAAQASAQIASAERDVQNAQADLARLNDLVSAARNDLAARQADAQNRIRNAQAQVDSAKASLSAIDGQITSTRAAIQAERDASARKIQDAQAKVDAAQGPVNDLDAQISALQGQIDQLNSDIAWWHNWYNRSSPIQKAYRWAQLSAEVGWRGTKVAGLTTAKGTLQASKVTADGVLQGARQSLQAARAAAVSYPIDQDPRMLALQGSRATAALAFQAAQGVLSATQQATAAGIAAAGQAVSSLAQQAGAATVVLQSATSALALVRQGVGDAAALAGYIAQHGLGALLEVKAASFDGAISTARGGVVTLDATVVFQGTPRTVHLTYDFHDLVGGAKALAGQVVPGLKI